MLLLIRTTLLLLAVVLLSQKFLFPFPQSEAPPKENLSPLFWIPDGNAKADDFPLKDTQVNTQISGVIANVAVVQVLENLGFKKI